MNWSVTMGRFPKCKKTNTNFYFFIFCRLNYFDSISRYCYTHFYMTMSEELCASIGLWWMVYACTYEATGWILNMMLDWYNQNVACVGMEGGGVLYFYLQLSDWLLCHLAATIFTIWSIRVPHLTHYQYSWLKVRGRNKQKRRQRSSLLFEGRNSFSSYFLWVWNI